VAAVIRPKSCKKSLAMLVDDVFTTPRAPIFKILFMKSVLQQRERQECAKFVLENTVYLLGVSEEGYFNNFQ